MTTSQGAAGAPSPGAGGSLELRHTTMDVLLGVVLLITGLIVLGDAVAASVVSAKVIGWTLVIGGAVALVLSVFRRTGPFWIGAMAGGLGMLAGLVCVRHTVVALAAITLAIGVLFMAIGLARFAAAAVMPEARGWLLVAGALNLLLGLIIFVRWPSASLWLVGTLLGVQLVVDGLSTMLVGRVRFHRAAT